MAAGTKKITVGLSGGVDSALAAFLLKEQGNGVKAVFMQNWVADDNDGYCSSKEDSLDAIAVADVLDIDIELVNFAAEYQERVFHYFLREYQAGRTPNPDVLCNSEIKFKAFLDYARTRGANGIATGHYVRKQEQNGVFCLLKARDLSKDQSYFLYRLNQDQIRHAYFPLGDWLKSEVRKRAQELNLPTALKKDSTGICFIGERPFRQFLQQYLPVAPGLMKTPDGLVVGKHSGLAFYTIGQRQGLGIGGVGPPWYVAAKNLPANELIVVQGHEHPRLYVDEIIINDLSFISGEKPREDRYQVKVRYRMNDVPARLSYQNGGKAILQFEQPVWAATPGQSAVIYDGDICLGGGIIAEVGRH